MHIRAVSGSSTVPAPTRMSGRSSASFRITRIAPRHRHRHLEHCHTARRNRLRHAPAPSPPNWPATPAPTQSPASPSEPQPYPYTLSPRIPSQLKSTAELQPSRHPSTAPPPPASPPTHPPASSWPAPHAPPRNPAPHTASPCPASAHRSDPKQTNLRRPPGPGSPCRRTSTRSTPCPPPQQNPPQQFAIGRRRLPHRAGDHLHRRELLHHPFRHRPITVQRMPGRTQRYRSDRSRHVPFMPNTAHPPAASGSG